ncbi:helix-turn-helix transcriptional regulator [Mucilaginibacter sp. UR6-11]|uniref:helix-turn-helix transcriptional regulator n=1 Tax=Mucilaginibacter sp. UR6-11 TaxID=1435644 RepID=UPI001E547662|nr:helix-turn-helix transcriptional regulator [Mucilaginibacter sp. UR6-11]MCC8427083.1 helix-turn-helix domain-containing protein [Mucilaginibacter sp. UR6-11]
MKEQKSTGQDMPLSDGTIVNLSDNRKRGKSLDQYKDEQLGKEGTTERDLFELELRMEMIQELIRDTRKKRNLSQQDLGDLIGVNKAQISKLEKGYTNATISLVSKVFKALNAKVKLSVQLDQEEFELV